MEDVHPLANIIVQAFFKKPHHDGTTLAPYLFGNAALGHKDFRYYRHVAEHALETLHASGALVRDGQGWYLLRRHNLERLRQPQAQAQPQAHP